MNRKIVYRLSSLLFTLLCFQILSYRVHTQTNYGTQSVNKVIEGTSSIHVWELIFPKAAYTMHLTLDKTGNVTVIGSLQYVIQVNTLKSKHGSQMDNNAYKAMNAKDHPTIRFSGSTGIVWQMVFV